MNKRVTKLSLVLIYGILATSFTYASPDEKQFTLRKSEKVLVEAGNRLGDFFLINPEWASEAEVVSTYLSEPLDMDSLVVVNYISENPDAPQNTGTVKFKKIAVKKGCSKYTNFICVDYNVFNRLGYKVKVTGIFMDGRYTYIHEKSQLKTTFIDNPEDTASTFGCTKDKYFCVNDEVSLKRVTWRKAIVSGIYSNGDVAILEVNDDGTFRGATPIASRYSPKSLIKIPENESKNRSQVIE